MTTPQDTGKAITEAPKPRSIRDLINDSAKELGRALPAHMSPERLVRIALTCIRTNPKLAQCTSESLMGALFVAAQLGVEPVAGRAYLIPFRNNSKKPDGQWRSVLEAQYVMGYKGVAELFYRHEKAVQLDWGVVKEGDEFDYALGTESFLRHKPRTSARGATIGYYAIATLKNGGKPFMFMSAEECMAHGREHSKTYDGKEKKFFGDSPWATDPDAMCLKTVLLQLSKLLPLSGVLQRALDVDGTTRHFNPHVTDALDMLSETDWSKKPPATPAGDAASTTTAE